MAAIPTTALAATGKQRQPSIHVSFMRTAMTGEIRGLGTKRILVGKLGCSIPPKVAVSAGRFVIGDPVKITCVGGILRTVKYAPAPDPGATYSAHPGPQPVVTTPSVATSSGQKGTVFNVSVVTLGSSTVEQQQTATGTISAITADSLTVGGLTCTMPPGLSLVPSFLSFVQVGNLATLTCGVTSGRLVRLSGSS
jgi:hypothetical protein